MRKKDTDNLQEEWLPIKGYEQYYEVSNMGNIRRTKPPSIGKAPPNKKIRNEDIPLFDKLNKEGISTEIIGKKFGINGSTIRKHLRKYRKNDNK